MGLQRSHSLKNHSGTLFAAWTGSVHNQAQLLCILYEGGLNLRPPSYIHQTPWKSGDARVWTLRGKINSDKFILPRKCDRSAHAPRSLLMNDQSYQGKPIWTIRVSCLMIRVSCLTIRVSYPNDFSNFPLPQPQIKPCKPQTLVPDTT